MRVGIKKSKGINSSQKMICMNHNGKTLQNEVFDHFRTLFLTLKNKTRQNKTGT